MPTDYNTLPNELRDKIWQFAAQIPRIVILHCDSRGWISSPTINSLLQTCHLSRVQALKVQTLKLCPRQQAPTESPSASLTGIIYLNPDDTLYYHDVGDRQFGLASLYMYLGATPVQIPKLMVHYRSAISHFGRGAIRDDPECWGETGFGFGFTRANYRVLMKAILVEQITFCVAQSWYFCRYGYRSTTACDVRGENLTVNSIYRKGSAYWAPESKRVPLEYMKERIDNAVEYFKDGGPKHYRLPEMWPPTFEFVRLHSREVQLARTAQRKKRKVVRTKGVYSLCSEEDLNGTEELLDTYRPPVVGLCRDWPLFGFH